MSGITGSMRSSSGSTTGVATRRRRTGGSDTQRLVLASTQLAPHKVSPGEQPLLPGLQAPLSQISLELQALPHPPQLAGSVCRSRQRPPHSVAPAGQVTEQIRAIDGVVAVDPVTGPYDVVARAEAADLDQLAKSTVMPMQELEGITRTLTCPVVHL